jgi:phosphatidylserine/phosphatidylglycerophosphate/cardiolipin synthase-like enzyme
MTRLLIQPDDGVAPLIAAMEAATTSIDMYLFRLAHPAIEKAIAAAIQRGVVVRTLVAHANGGRKEDLRKLESRLLAIGATVSRTDNDLIRYHGKMMVVDRQCLYLLGYNFTHKDIERSRSLGIATEAPDLVGEAVRLFEADFDRRIYTPALDTLVVSPLNARASLLALIDGAKRRLMIYDARLTDELMRRAITRQALAGVEVRVIGRFKEPPDAVQVLRSATERLHVRAIVQDDRSVFIGSQSLRRLALERRREIGLITSEAGIVEQVSSTFELDWARHLAMQSVGAKRPNAAAAGK